MISSPKSSAMTPGYRPYGKVVIGTVQGDMHDIGKNIAAMVPEAAGFEVTDPWVKGTRCSVAWSKTDAWG